MQDNESNETHEDENNLNESVEDIIDPVKNSIGTTDSDDDGDLASNNNNDQLNTLTYGLTKPVPDVEGNEEIINVIKFLTTIPVPADPMFPDGVVNSSGHWVRPAGWVHPKGSSADSSFSKTGDPSELNTLLPPATQSQYSPSAEGMAGVLTEDSTGVNNVEKEALIELLVCTVHYYPVPTRTDRYERSPIPNLTNILNEHYSKK